MPSARDEVMNMAKDRHPSVKMCAELMLTVNDDTLAERLRQNEKWGVQRHDYGTWMLIAGEEFGEICQAFQTGKGWGKPTDAKNAYEELIQLSAVCQAIAEQVKEEGGF
ncbi:hypothetical protein [Cytobacillus horneckiae]|uniref:hypothetical protein n=1 Tax=Cytobacillus horneckiae TaxID=549687 RepID=UPI003D9A71A4